MGNDNITIRDLAKLAGVSTATVSRALAGSDKVKEETRDKIIELARRNNFEPSAVASSLSSQKRNIIGILIDDIANPFFVQVVKGIEKEIDNSNYSMIIASSNWDPQKEIELVRTMIRNRVAGVVIAPTDDDSEALDLLRRYGMPFVVINSRGKKGDTFICTDNLKGGYLAANHLIARGINRLVYLVGFPHSSSGERVSGLKKAVRESGRSDIDVIECPQVRTFEEGYESAASIISRYRLDLPLSGLFALNDVVAAGFLKGAVELNIPIPDNLSIIGFDDIFFANLFRIPLTTVMQPKEEMGKIAVEALLKIIEDETIEPLGRILQPRLIVRDT